MLIEGFKTYHLPLRIRKRAEAFEISDGHGETIALFPYKEEWRGLRGEMRTEAKAREIAQFVAQMLTHFHARTQMQLFMERLPHHANRLAREKRG